APPDHTGGLGRHQGLIDGLSSLADAVINLRDLECVQDLQQCRLVKSHRALCPFARTIGLVSLTIARWPLYSGQLRPRPTTYTTRWDATATGGAGSLSSLSPCPSFGVARQTSSDGHCAPDPFVQGRGDRSEHRRCRLPVDPAH